MSLIECPDCGKRVMNLGLHLERECVKRKKRSGVAAAAVPAVEGAAAGSVERKRGRPSLGRVCRVCGRPVHARGLCRNHYQQEWVKGGGDVNT